VYLIGNFFQVPDESNEMSTSNDSNPTSLKSSTDSLSKIKPARPPPPVLGKTPTKNMSALHTHPVLQQAITSPNADSPQTSANTECPTNGSALHRVISAPFSHIHKIMGSPARATITNVTKRKLFGVSARPLPEAPNNDENGEIYCVIEDDDHYELSESNGSRLLPHRNHRIPGMGPNATSPPPLPVRGPPAVPNLDTLPPKPKFMSRPQSQSDDLEEYDIPEDLSYLNQAVNNSIVSSDDPHESVEIAPLPQDLSLVMPSYPMSPKRNEVPQPPLPQKNVINNIEDDDDDVYKVPTSHSIEEIIYQVPAADPIPVGNNNLITTKQNSNFNQEFQCLQEVNSSMEDDVDNSTELYQIPSSEVIPVSFANTPTPSKIPITNKLPTTSLPTAPCTNVTPPKSCITSIPRPVSTELSVPRPSVFSGSKGSSSVNVKERIAQINSNKKESTLTRSPVKNTDDVVVMLGNHEIKLDQDKKKAFLESTLKFNKK